MNPQWSLDLAGMKHMPVPRLGSLTAPVPRRATDTRKTNVETLLRATVWKVQPRKQLVDDDYRISIGGSKLEKAVL